MNTIRPATYFYSPVINAVYLLIAIAILVAFQLPLSARTWTQSATGNTIKGDFVKVDLGMVHLRLAGNKLIQIPIATLSPDDVNFIKGRSQSPTANTPVSAAPNALTPLTKTQVTGVREWSDGSGGTTKGAFNTMIGNLILLDIEKDRIASQKSLEDDKWPLADIRAIWHAQALHYSPNALGPPTTDPALLSKVAVTTSKKRLNSWSVGNMVNIRTREVVSSNVTRTTKGIRYKTIIDVPFEFTGELTLIWNNQTVQVLPIDFSLLRDFYQLLLKAEVEMKPLSGRKDEHAAQITKIAETLYTAAKAREDWHHDMYHLANTEHIAGGYWRSYLRDEKFYTTKVGSSGIIRPAQKLPDLLKAGGSREASEEFRKLRDLVRFGIKGMSKACVDETIWTTTIEPVFPTSGDTDRALLVIKAPNGQELAREVIKKDTVKKKTR